MTTFLCYKSHEAYEDRKVDKEGMSLFIQKSNCLFRLGLIFILHDNNSPITASAYHRLQPTVRPFIRLLVCDD